MTPTAREVVAAYLQSKAESTKPQEQRDRVVSATREIVDELPDGFTTRDLRTCVGDYLKDAAGMDGMTASRVSRTVTKTHNDMVADGRLAIDPTSGGSYVHRGA